MSRTWSHFEENVCFCFSSINALWIVATPKKYFKYIIKEMARMGWSDFGTGLSYPAGLSQTCAGPFFCCIRPSPGLLPVLGPLERYRLLHLMWPCLLALGRVLLCRTSDSITIGTVRQLEWLLSSGTSEYIKRWNEQKQNKPMETSETSSPYSLSQVCKGLKKHFGL